MAQPQKISWSSFQGIDRNITSTKINNKLLKTQNFYPKKPGSLSKTPGSFPFTEERSDIERIYAHYEYYHENFGAKLLAFCKMTQLIDPPDAPILDSPSDATPYAGLDASITYRLGYTFVGCGGETKMSQTADIALGPAETQFMVTIPGDNFPIGVRKVNIYVQYNATGNFLLYDILDVDQANPTASLSTMINKRPKVVSNTVYTASTPITILDLNTSAFTPLGNLKQGVYFYAVAAWGSAFTTGLGVGGVVDIKSFYVETDNQIINIPVPYQGDFSVTIPAGGVSAAAILIGTSPSLMSIYKIIPVLAGNRPVLPPYSYIPITLPSGGFSNFSYNQTTLSTKNVGDINYVNENLTGSHSIVVFDEAGRLERELVPAYYPAENVTTTQSKATVFSLPSNAKSIRHRDSDDVHFATCLNRCFIANNLMPLMKTDGYTLAFIGPFNTGIVDPNDSTTNPASFIPRPKYITTFNNSLVIGGGNSGEEFVYFSLPGDPDVFTRDRLASQINAIFVSSDKGDPISGLGVASSVGTDGPGSGLFIGKTKTVHFFNQLPIMPGMASPKRILDKTDGCSSHLSIVMTPMGTLYAGRDSIWMVDGGGNVVDVGSPITGILKTIPISEKHKSHACYHDGFYKIFIPTKDGLTTQFWLDLRKANTEGSVASWYGPHISPVCLRSIARDGNEHYNDRLGLDVNGKRLTLMDIVANNAYAYDTRVYFGLGLNQTSFAISDSLGNAPYKTFPRVANKRDVPVTFPASGSTVSNASGITLTDGLSFKFKNTTSVDVTVGIDYYVQYLTDTTFTVSTTPDGSPVVFTGATTADIDLELASNQIYINEGEDIGVDWFIRFDSDDGTYDTIVTNVYGNKITVKESIVGEVLDSAVYYNDDLDIEAGSTVKTEDLIISLNSSNKVTIGYEDGTPITDIENDTKIIIESLPTPKTTPSGLLLNTPYYVTQDGAGGYTLSLTIGGASATFNSGYYGRLYTPTFKVTAADSIRRIEIESNDGYSYNTVPLMITRNVGRFTHAEISPLGYVYKSNIQSVLSTGDLDFGEPRVQKRLYSVFSSVSSEKDADLSVEIVKNREEASRYSSSIVNVPTEAVAWDQEYWNNDVISGNLGQKLHSAYFRGVQLAETFRVELIHDGDSDILISDFGLNVDYEKRIIVR